MELGLSGAGGGLTERLFDASLLFGKELAAQQLNLPALSSENKVVTSAGPGSVSFSNDQAGGFDQKTILLLAGAALLIYWLA